MISNPSTSSMLHHAPSCKEKLPKVFQRTTLGFLPLSLCCITCWGLQQARILKNLQSQHPSLVHRGSESRNALFVWCHSRKWSISSSLACIHGWQWAFTSAPVQYSNTKEFIPADRFPSPVCSMLTGEVGCALFLSASHISLAAPQKASGGKS